MRPQQGPAWMLVRRGWGMTCVQTLYAALQKANGDYASANTDEGLAEAAARQFDAVTALAGAQCIDGWDLHAQTRALYDLVRDESNDDAHWEDGRVQLLAAAVERNAATMARRYGDMRAAA